MEETFLKLGRKLHKIAIDSSKKYLVIGSKLLKN